MFSMSYSWLQWNLNYRDGLGPAADIAMTAVACAEITGNH